MNAESLKLAVGKISLSMASNADYLVSLDQQNGDGDLGLYMKAGFASVSAAWKDSQEKDLGRLFLQASRVFNECAPSSLGTVFSIGMMAMAKALKGKLSVTPEEMGGVIEQGLDAIMRRTNSKLGEKTVLDALAPAAAALRMTGSLTETASAAADGAESTRAMRAVHGRAAYYGDKSIGILDGGSVAVKLIFEALV